MCHWKCLVVVGCKKWSLFAGKWPIGKIKRPLEIHKPLHLMVRLVGFEPTTYGLEVFKASIMLISQ